MVDFDALAALIPSERADKFVPIIKKCGTKGKFNILQD